MGEHLKSSRPRIGNLKVLVLLSLILAIVLPLIASLIAPSVSSTPGDPPDYIYLTWATPDTAHTINVSWRTDENYVGEVRYDNESHGGVPGAYSYNKNGTGGVTTDNLAGYFHHVELTGLEPDTIYYFICGRENNWSDERSFRTAPDNRKNFKFAAGGDSRADGRYEFADWPEARDNVSDLMAHYNPSFALFIGDFLWRGDDPGKDNYDENDTWDNWLGATDIYWNTTDNRMIPLIPVIGNHELYPPYPQPTEGDYYPDHGYNYYTVFNLPGNERWYALDWGPDLRIIVLDSEVLDEGSVTWQEQLEWLESELENSENYLLKVAAFHRPIVSSGSWWYSRLENWGYLFTKYGVDVVFQGHIHYYDRSYPIDSDPPPGEIAPPGEGVIYVVSGGWGAPLSYGGPQPYTAYGPESEYHFTLVDVFKNGTLHSQAIDQYGTVFDEFSIYGSVEVSISPSEDSGLAGVTLNYEVTVKNIRNVTDNYLLENVDNSGWTLELENSVLEVPARENRTTTLTVTIPENAEPGTEDNIIVIATSMAENTVRDNDSCIARAIPPRAELSLATLYKDELDLLRYLENGSKLVVKFYTYTGDNQGENVVWENVTPAYVTLLENVPHPLGKPVENTMLILTNDNIEEVISTLASFTVHQSDLKDRFFEILGEWFPHPELHDAFRAEVKDILGQWFAAPP